MCKRVMEYMVAEYRGSGDLEVFDAYDFVEYFANKYIGNGDRNNLKARILELREFAQRAAPGSNAPS